MIKVKPSIVKVYHPVTNEDLFYPGAYTQKNFESALSYKAKSTDVFVCSYPKCGTTWLQNITWLILHNGEEIQNNIRQSIPMLDFDGADIVDEISDSDFPRVIKTHVPQKWVPYHSEAKYLYITRNVKDSFVSKYFHVLGYPQFFDAKGLQMNTFFDLFIKGEISFGSYFDHVVSWYAKRNEANVLFLLYEDLKKDVRRGILKIAKFLGDHYEENLRENENQLLERIVELTEFKKMKSETNKWSDLQRPDDLPFIRKGEVGDWRNYLTKEQSQTFDRMLVKKGRESGVDQLWKEYPEL